MLARLTTGTVCSKLSSSVMPNRQEFGVENEIGQVTCDEKEVLKTCIEQKIPKVACKSIMKCSLGVENAIL